MPAWGYDPNGLVLPSLCDGRLSLSATEPVTTSDQQNKQTVYWHPFRGNLVSLYNGSIWRTHTIGSVKSIGFQSASDRNQDIFVYDNNGTLTLERVLWTDDTTRASALAFQDGVYVKASDPTRRYLGTGRTLTLDNCWDTDKYRFLWNYYHRCKRKLLVADATAGWSYSGDWRQARGSTDNQVEVVVGVQESLVYLAVHHQVEQNALGYGSPHTGIGKGSSTVNSADLGSVQQTINDAYASGQIHLHAFLEEYAQAGYTDYRWLEKGTASVGTFIWRGTALGQAGMIGWIEG